MYTFIFKVITIAGIFNILVDVYFKHDHNSITEGVDTPLQFKIVFNYEIRITFCVD